MSLTKTYSYSTSTNYTFDSSRVTFENSDARLKLTSGVVAFTQNFTSSTGFTYDAAKTEFTTGSTMQQLDVSPTNSICAATFTTDEDLSWGVTNLTGTLSGSAYVSSGSLVCAGSDGVVYADTDIGSTSTGTIKFKYTPNYTTAPPTNVNLVALAPSSGNNDKIFLTNSPSGNNIRLTAFNSTGGTVLSAATTIGGVWAPVAGTEYEFELNFDSTTGDFHVMIDGVLHGTLSPGAWTRGTNADRLVVGGSTIVSYNRAEGSFRDVILYGAIQHTAGYTPGYTLEETLYVEDAITLPSMDHSGDGGILALSTITSTEANTPKYTVQLSGTGDFLYWDGAAWSTSDGTYAQANTKVEVNTNASALTLDQESSLTFKIHFNGQNDKGSIDTLTANTSSNAGYFTDNPTILSTDLIGIDDIDDWAQTATLTGSDLVKWVIVFGGQDYYHDGADWATSDGTYAQSNTQAEILTNQATIVGIVGNGGTFAPKAFLHSDDGSTTPALESLTVEYNFFGSPTAPTNTVVYGYVFNCSTPRSGVVINLTSNMHTTDGNNNIIYHSTTQTTTSTGYFEATLPKTNHISSAYINMTVTDTDILGNTTTRRYKLDVTATETAQRFEDLLV